MQLNGILLYNGDTARTREHLVIELSSGFVRVSFDFGKFPGSNLYSDVRINDGLVHKVCLLSELLHYKVDDVYLSLFSDLFLGSRGWWGSKESQDPSNFQRFTPQVAFIKNSARKRGCNVAGQNDVRDSLGSIATGVA